MMALAACSAGGTKTGLSTTATTVAPAVTSAVTTSPIATTTIPIATTRGTTGIISTTPAPTTTVAKFGTRANPVPLGSDGTFDNNWTVKVLGTTPDASAVIKAQNLFNDPPAAGMQFFMANVSATYTGPSSSNALGDLTFSALDSGNTQIKEGSCGVLPNEFDFFKDVFTGGTLTGNICFAVPTATVASLVMYIDAGLLGRQRAFFALR